jgi:hypothetical protein
MCVIQIILRGGRVEARAGHSKNSNKKSFAFPLGTSIRAFPKFLEWKRYFLALLSDRGVLKIFFKVLLLGGRAWIFG